MTIKTGLGPLIDIPLALVAGVGGGAIWIGLAIWIGVKLGGDQGGAIAGVIAAIALALVIG